ncbi:GAF and ANTAR domain-containing protein [Streptomyces sp. BH-SS-21]|uniref:GAF and ANTAR domain-containing protein n=1 Tax=Streptomyces liliiviolaceus TaxID=2823109 RepID=A0A940Y036_9ACTN|nr:GAF and ANTAR domain-containing protein [Streptomyces liliiviolaceus]MBQ0850371.1 GAF and ANTAR domain-containing protein [Streptomyces liliiviolaceus]
MSREQHIARTFVYLADTLVEDFDVADFLQQMTVRCTELLDVAGAAVFLEPSDSGLHAVAPHDRGPRLLEVLHGACGQGPTRDACRTGRTVTTEDLDAAAARWPQFLRQLHAADCTGATAVPLRLRDDTVGSLLLLHTAGRRLNDGELDLAQALARAATIGLLHARTHHQSRTVTEQLRGALDSRVVVEQAKGLLSARHGISLDDAFALLRHYARSRRLLLSSVARDVIEHQPVPGPAPSRSQTRAPDTP